MSTETKAYDGKIVVNTLASMVLQDTNFLGLDMEYKEKSTLNEHLGILRDELPGPRERAEAKYLVLGNRGHVLNNDLATPVPIPHDPTDAAPYGIVPVVLRPIDKDLSDKEREKYALRKRVNIKGRDYWAYYMLRLDYRGVKCDCWYTQVRDGQKNITEFEYTDQNLHPEPKGLPDYDYEATDKVVNSDGDYVNGSTALQIPLTAEDVQEILNVAKIMYGNPMMAVVSEFCLCSGVDTTTTGQSATGSSFQYEEVTGAQVAVFMSTFVNLALNNGGIAYKLMVGQTEPMPMRPGQDIASKPSEGSPLESLV